MGMPRLLNETYLCVTRLQMDPLYYRTALAATCKLGRCWPVLRSEMEGRHLHIDVEGTLARRDNWCSGLMLPSILHEKNKLNRKFMSGLVRQIKGQCETHPMDLPGRSNRTRRS